MNAGGVIKLKMLTENSTYCTARSESNNSKGNRIPHNTGTPMHTHFFNVQYGIKIRLWEQT